MKNFEIFPKKFGILPYIFLFYLIMPLFYIFEETGIKAVMGYSMLLLFLVSYRELYNVKSEKKYSFWLAIQIIIVMIFSILYNPYIIFMGFFPANFVGWYEQKKDFRRALTLFAFSMILTMTIVIYLGEMVDFLFFIPFLVVMISSPIGIRTMNERMTLEQKLDQANEQIKELIKREERVRIARDLHDTLGHTLSLITLQSQLVQRLAESNPERAKLEAKEIEMTSRSALREVRELVSDMRTITLEEEIVDLEQILNAAGIEFHMKKNSELPDLPLLQQNILGMCLREAGTNIVKHSKAKKCYVDIQGSKGNVTISVIDDGIGLVDSYTSGNGLKGMRERLSLIEGKLDIHKTNGTKLVMSVPVIVKLKEGMPYDPACDCRRPADVKRSSRHATRF